jgi:hypothetical protein
MAWKDCDLPFNDLKNLPQQQDLETPRIIKKAIEANRFFGRTQRLL